MDSPPLRAPGAVTHAPPAGPDATGPAPAVGDPRDGTLHVATIAAHAGRPTRAPGAPLNPPIVAASTFHAGGEHAYARYGTPLWQAFEEAIAALEGATGAVAFASGMAAIHGVLDELPLGAVAAVPTGTYFEVAEAFRRRETAGALTIRWLDDPTDVTDLSVQLQGCDVLWLETPTNPCVDAIDVAAFARAAAPGTLVVVDSTLATPVLVQPLRLGAHVVVHSATKQIAGHSDAVIGVAATRDPELLGRLVVGRNDRGAVPGDLETYLALRGLRTLPLRVERAQESAGVLAERLLAHPSVDQVRWPGWGTLLAIEVAGGAEAAERVVHAVELWTHATSLGDVTSLVERRRRWGSESPIVSESLLRLSVGIEHVEDLWTDLDRALRAAG